VKSSPLIQHLTSEECMVPPDISDLFQPMWITRFVESQPLWRRLLARYFDRYKFSKEEYLNWLYALNQ